jgi:hypothetical protein
MENYTRTKYILVIVGLLLSNVVGYAESPHAKQLNTFLTEHPEAIPLIVIKDGKGDFSNWERFRAEVIDGDHVHVPKTSPGTKQSFKDFKLVFEFKLKPGANSGIFLRHPGKGGGYDSMCELQVLDNTAKQYAKLDPRQYHASAYGITAAKRGHLKPVGEWNYQEVIVRGHTIVVNLNGEKILDTDVSKVTETKKGKMHKGQLNLEGALVLGGHASGVFYRNMYVTSLDKGIEYKQGEFIQSRP